MAEPNDMMAREIDEELRRERLLQLWDKYGTYVVAAAVAIVVGVIGYQFYQGRRAAANEAASIQYIIALRDLAFNKNAEAQKALEELAANAPSGYAALARLRLAAAEEGGGNAEYAAAAYDEIAKDSGIDPILADYAKLQVAMLKLEAGSFTDVKNRLTPLANDRNPWRYSARELLGIAAYKAGRGPEARSYFQRLVSDRLTPPGILERSRVMIALLNEAEQASSASPPADKSDAPSGKEPAAEKDTVKPKAVDKKTN